MRNLNFTNVFSKLILSCGLLSTLLFFKLTLASPIAGSELPDLLDRVMPGVVNISSITVVNYTVYGMDDFFQFWGIPKEQKHTSRGSGFIIDKDGYILTNDHVVAEATEVLITLLNQHQYHAKIIGRDPKMDIALLKIDDKTQKITDSITFVALGDSEKIRIGESVFAVGNPFGLEHTVTLGIISAKNRTIGSGPYNNFVQTDASINPGNSGGPLFNLKGEVIGINRFILSQTGQSGGLGFAIPVNEATAILSDLKKFGRVPRPWLGVLGERLTMSHKQYYNLSISQGVLVYNLVLGSPADKAGLMRGDIILSLNNFPIKETNDLDRLLTQHKPNDKIKMEVQRQGRKLTLKIQLKELPAQLDKLPRGII